MKVTRVQEMRAMDQTAIEQYGIPADLLMENAGMAIAQTLWEEFNIPGKRFLFLCGLGNNGGDGLVAARMLHSKGCEVMVCIAGDPARYRGSARMNYAILSRMPITLNALGDIVAFHPMLSTSDVIIDALFGTGLSRPVSGLHRALIDAVNASKKPVLSVDIPSGIHGDSGQIMGAAIQANLTVTFGLPKPGNMLPPGSTLGGKLFVSHISFPPTLHQSDELQIQTNWPLQEAAQTQFVERSSFPTAIIHAGTMAQGNHPLAVAHAFLKAGGGHVKLVCKPVQGGASDEDQGRIEYLPALDGSEWQASSDPLDLGFIGPSLSKPCQAITFWDGLLENLELPLFLDGEAVDVAFRHREQVHARRAGTILTPSTDDMARYFGMATAEISPNPLDLVQQMAMDLQAWIVLKTSPILIGCPNGKGLINKQMSNVAITTEALRWMPAIIAANLQSAIPLTHAVRWGVFVFGAAWDLAQGESALKPAEADAIFKHIPDVLQSLGGERSQIQWETYEAATVL